MRRLGVFEVIKRFRDSNVLHSKWNFKMKTDAEGQVECFEDRIVFCGNEQKIGVDYFIVAAAIMDMSTVKIVLALDLFWVFQLNMVTCRTPTRRRTTKWRGYFPTCTRRYGIYKSQAK